MYFAVTTFIYKSAIFYLMVVKDCDGRLKNKDIDQELDSTTIRTIICCFFRVLRVLRGMNGSSNI